MSKKLKEKKAKLREKRVKEELRVKRQAKRKAEKAKRLENEKFEKEWNLINRNNEKEKETIEKLENNMRILKALKEEHDNEIRQREELNESLEKEGMTSLKEKLDKLESTLKEKINEENKKD